MVRFVIILLVLPILPTLYLRVEGQTLIQRTLAAVFLTPVQPGCSLPTKEQQDYCLLIPGLLSMMASAKQLVQETCPVSFKNEFWNCPTPNQTSFQIVTRETAFFQALYSAALGYSAAKKCRLGDHGCECGAPTGQSDIKHTLAIGVCPENVQYGLQVTSDLLGLNQEAPSQDDSISRHNVDIGLKVLERSTEEKCTCLSSMGSCIHKTCYMQLWPFMAIVDVLREYYKIAVLLQPSDNINTSFARMDRLLYSAPTVVDCNTSGRVCLTRPQCAALCCGRGFRTQTHISPRYCRCRWEGPHSLSLACDVCYNNRISFICN